jgi:hypothetical protein
MPEPHARIDQPVPRPRPKDLWPPWLWAHITLLLLVGILLAGTVGVALWWALGQPQLTTGKLDTRQQIEALKLVLAVVGGMAAVVALTVAYRKQRHEEIAQHREDTKLFDERYAKGAELLGHERAAARMAGVYALARLADDAASSDLRQQCIDALCAYLRLPYEPSNTSSDSRAERTVRHTTLRVIRDHLREGFAPVSWNGHKFNLAEAVFDGGDLAQICLTRGHMTFHDATFASGDFTFEGAKILGEARAWFTDTKFAGGNVDFAKVTFDGGKVSFKRAHFNAGAVSFAEALDPRKTVSFEEADLGAASVDWGPFPPPSNTPPSSRRAPHRLSCFSPWKTLLRAQTTRQ